MKARAASLALLALTAAAPSAPERAKAFHPAQPGLVVELQSELDAAGETTLLARLRATGATVFGIEASWPSLEPSPGHYEVGEVVRAARILRQSGASIYLNLPIVSGREKTVAADLASTAFDDPRLSVRLGRLLDALEPALRDASTISLGYEADVYFADKPEELKAYRHLFDGAVTFLKASAPNVLVGVATLAPAESPAPVVAAMLHQHSPVLFYLYAPFVPGKPYIHRPPAVIDRDWRQLLDRAQGRPIAFPEVSFSSSPVNGSSPQLQAEFIRRMRRLMAATDERRLLFARYATLRDEPAVAEEGKSTPAAIRRAAFLANRGLETVSGEPKPAWKEWITAGR